MWAFIMAHQTIAVLIAYYVGSAFVSSLPAPQAGSSMFYIFIFRFTNALAANLSRAYSTSVEQSPNFVAAVAIANKKENT
jgi:hypothetical protein